MGKWASVCNSIHLNGPINLTRALEWVEGSKIDPSLKHSLWLWSSRVLKNRRKRLESWLNNREYCCSSRGLEFDSTTGSSQPLVSPAPGNPVASSGLSRYLSTCAIDSHMHTCMHMHIKAFLRTKYGKKSAIERTGTTTSKDITILSVDGIFKISGVINSTNSCFSCTYNLTYGSRHHPWKATVKNVEFSLILHSLGSFIFRVYCQR